ncbi:MULTISPECIES: extracellular solute-binding protein [unclassified Candidatus Frackibacter]|uniref:extracellular solute-binding protein n=1 Tax=unclassified Candidatus Frackibacter TaxID=2648818 RepID=UPI00088B91CC|nr:MULTISPECIES: extracellular solute-binding protein [unclassified Candidatus Frackibacter]SDB96743.1 molybdate/tungstate transport system substrate-binding protein [Candidatus Frackibacter sp. WG11]SEM28244.1 molybdate/tungstate transport system substrate-binding protein [Candidatus Frackibacter sp. WG12]SFL33130.1 molybdate/tungstate transport system substrate-binding protein [Candidatus Frackibacter sp. WG13]
MKKLWVLILILIGLVLITSITNISLFITEQNLKEIYAGSLLNVMENKVNPALEQNLNLKVVGESHGSVSGARMIKEGLRYPDIYLSADPTVNEQLLFGDKNDNLIDWYISFLSNELVIAYNSGNKFGDEIKQVESGDIAWYKLLLNDEFRLGRTDPNLDPKGYRTLFMLDLAAKYYNEPNLKRRVLNTNNQQLIFPETELMAMLETGQIDAAVTYRNEAIERNLSYISLPDQVNLSNPKFAELYNQVSYKTDKGEVFKGRPILYTITILNKVENKSEAVKAVEYTLSQEGRKLFKENGFNLVPIQLKGKKKVLPTKLKKYIEGEIDFE